MEFQQNESTRFFKFFSGQLVTEFEGAVFDRVVNAIRRFDHQHFQKEFSVKKYSGLYLKKKKN